VEDDGAVRELLTEAFELDGRKVAAVASGDEALRALEAGPLPDLVVLDMNVPGVHGSEVLRRMKAHPDWASIPVAAISGTPLQEFRLMAEPDAYLHKPFEMEALNETLSRLCHDRKRRERQSRLDAARRPA
jgi:two-component system chemotaxis response regulator CheY